MFIEESLKADKYDDLPLLTEAEQYQLLVEWNNTHTNYPNNICIHQLFEAQVKRTPQSVAAIFDNQQLTYQELNHCANQLAHHLQTLGVKPEVLVGICLERSLLMVIGLLAILKAGGAYVPLDPDYPNERLAFMLEDTQVPILLTQKSLVEKLSANQAHIVCLDMDWDKINCQRDEPPICKARADNLAYVIYTSGSTGKPKGVAVPHQAVSRLLFNTNYIQLEADDKIAQVSNTSFDAATFEIWGALFHGGTLIIIPKNVLLSPKDFEREIHKQEISVLFLTTALFNQLASTVPQAFKNLRYLLFGGEAVDPRWVKEIIKKASPQRLIHVYGPTESTTFSSWYLVQDVPEGTKTLPIGRPISNTQIYILDRYYKPVPLGVPGEIHIGGAGLARGYLNRSKLTEEKFIPNPFQNKKKTKENSFLKTELLYKTGDLARYLPDGNIEFLGRIDNQVKIRGFRIEIGEIEAVLTQYLSIQQTVVIAREDNPGEKRLVAYIVSHPEQTVTTDEIRCFLKQKLPDYMIPGAFVFLDALPLTPNGKIDRCALPKPDFSWSDMEETFVAPRAPTEQKVADIWISELKLEKVSIHDDFFELGGHSLIATQIISRLDQAFNIEFLLADIFEVPTVAELSSRIEAIFWARQQLTPSENNSTDEYEEGRL